MPGVVRLAKKGMMYLKTRGVRETSRRAVLHVQRKQAEKRYVRNMIPSPNVLKAQMEESINWSIRFSVVVPLYNTPLNLLKEMISSVRNQSYQFWELCLVDGSDEAHGEVENVCRKIAEEDERIRYQKLKENGGISGNSNAALEMATGEYIALLDHDDLLREDALYQMAKSIRDTGADFLYSDEVIFQSPRLTDIVGIHFKPDFAPMDLLMNNYICHLTVFWRDLLQKTEPFRSAYDGSQDHDLILRLTNAAEKVVHIPEVLYYWRSVKGSTASDIHTKEYAISAGKRAVESFLKSRGRTEAKVESTEVFPTMFRVQEPVEGNPSVRIIIGVQKNTDATDKLQMIRTNTTWPNSALCLAEYDPGTGKTRREAMQHAAEESAEDYLLFLDGVPEIQTPDWIQEMLRLAQLAEVGAVGARIHFSGSEDLRHSGIILGLGPMETAGRPYYRKYDDHVGFFGQLAVVREVSAVTDCVMVRREKWKESGGFDENYRDALFDLDLCLKLREKGYRNLWTPYACLSLGKPKDCGMDAGREFGTYEEDRGVFRRKWNETLSTGDPYYNPNLSLKHEDWRIKI